MLSISRGGFFRSWGWCQIGAIIKSFQKSVANIEHQYKTLFNSRLYYFISRQCTQHIAKELERVKFVGTDKVVCGCFIRITHGLLCACDLVGLQIQGYTNPLRSIRVTWKKLHIEEHQVYE